MGLSPALLIPYLGTLSSPLAIRPDLWLRPSSSTCHTGGCRTFTASDKSCFSVASSAAHNLGTGDALLPFAVNRSATGNQVIMGKYQDANNYWRLEFTAAHKLHFIAVASGTTKIEITSTTAYSTTGAWIFGCVAIDRSAAANCKIYVYGADDTAGTSTTSTDDIDNTGATYVGQSGADTLFLAGSIASLAIGKPADVTTVVTAAVASFYNTRNAKTYAELTDAEVTDYGVTCWYNGNETDPAANLVDQHDLPGDGSNDLIRTHAEMLSDTGFETLTGWTGIDFAATDKAYLVSPSTGFRDTTEALTISLMVKLKSVDASQMVISFDDVGGHRNWSFLYNKPTDSWFVEGFPLIQWPTGVTPSINTDYHVLLYWKASDRKWYLSINGADEISSDAMSGDLNDANTFFVAGGRADGAYLDGKLGKIQIWNRELTSGEKTSIRNSNKGKYYNELTAGEKTGCVAAWDLTDGPYSATQTANDFVGSNDLSFSAAELVTNGTFDSDLTGWSNGSANPWDTCEQSSGKMHVVQNGDGTPAYGITFQAITCVVGRSYTFRYSVEKVSGTNCGIDFTDGESGTIGAGGYGVVKVDSETVSANVVAVYATTYVRFYSQNNTADEWNIDNVSIKAASIPLASDANLFGSWAVGNTGTTHWEIETGANVESGAISARCQHEAGTIAWIYQVKLTSGTTYSVSVRAKNNSGTVANGLGASAGSTNILLCTLTETYTTYTGTGVAAGSGWAVFQSQAGVNRRVYIDTVSYKAASIAVGNGPAEAIASDSVGTNHATLTGKSAAALITDWTTSISTALDDGGYALILDGTDDYVACGNVGNVTSLDFYVKLLADNQELCTLANSTATAITVAAGTLTFGASLTASAVAIDDTDYTADLAAAGALLNDNAWHHVQITISSVAATAFNIGTDSSAYGNIVVDEWKLGTAHTWSFDDGPFGQPGDEDPILSWVSGDGDRYLLYQTTAASRPSYELLGINSLPSLDFDGTDCLYVPSTTAARVALPTVLIVASADDPTTASVQVLLSIQDDGSANNFLYFGIDTNGKFVVVGNDAGVTFSVTGSTVFDTAAHMLEATWDGTNWHLKVDGVAETETRSGTECGPTDIDNMDSTTVGACYTNGAAAGASLHFAGLIADITLKSNLSVGSLLKLERHYTTRYGL